MAKPSDNDEAMVQLLKYRKSIDNMDACLVHLLAERFRLTKAVGHLKQQYDLPPADKDREKAQAIRLRQMAEDAELDPDFAEKFLNFVIEEVIRHHNQIKADPAAYD